jgi:hypothetical protein
MAFPGTKIAWSGKLGTEPHPVVCIQTPSTGPAPGVLLIANFWISVL